MLLDGGVLVRDQIGLSVFAGKRAPNRSLSYRQKSCILSRCPGINKKRAGNPKDTAWLTRIPAPQRSRATRFSSSVRIAPGARITNCPLHPCISGEPAGQPPVEASDSGTVPSDLFLLLLKTLRALFAILLALGVALPAYAQIENSGFPVLQLEPSARTAALAGSSTALIDAGSGALFSNPALLTPEADGRVEFSWLNHLSDINAGWVAYGKDMGAMGTWAAGVRYLSFGQFDERNELGEKTGTFSASDMALTLGGSRIWRPGLRYGAALSLMHASLASHGATGMGLDAGLIFDDSERQQSFGVTVHNFGFVLSSIGERSDALPADLRIGYTRRLAHLPLLVSVTGYRLHKMDGGPDDTGAIARILYHTRLAGEFQFSESFRIRFGYDHRRHDELKVKTRLDMAGFSTGLGIRVSRFAFDYALNSWSSLGGLHRITIASSL